MMYSKIDGRDYKICSREYERFRTIFAETVSINMSGKSKSPEAIEKLKIKLRLHVGWNHTEKTIEKFKTTIKNKRDSGYDMGSHLRGIKKPKEFCDNQAVRMTG